MKNNTPTDPKTLQPKNRSARLFLGGRLQYKPLHHEESLDNSICNLHTKGFFVEYAFRWILLNRIAYDKAFGGTTKISYVLCDPNVKKQQSPENLEIGKCGNSEFDRDAFVIVKDCYFQM